MHDRIRYAESRDFREGYDAAALGLPLDHSRPREWREGWSAFHATETRSENARAA